MQTNLIFCKFAGIEITMTITFGSITITFKKNSSITITGEKMSYNYILLLSHVFALEKLP